MKEYIEIPRIAVSGRNISILTTPTVSGCITYTLEEAQLLVLQVSQAIAIITGMPGHEKVEKYIQNVCNHYSITQDALVRGSRKKVFVEARTILAYLIRQNTNYPLEKIGKIIGRDHSTVVSCVKNVKNWSLHDKEFKARVDKLSVL